MFRRGMLLFIYFLICLQGGQAQESLDQNEFFDPMVKAFQLYDDQQYDAAHALFEEVLNKDNPKYSPEQRDKWTYYKALSNYLGSPQSIEELIQFTKYHKTSEWLNEARIDIGVHYYNDESFLEAINYFAEVDLDALSNDRFSEVHFKKAYAHFVRKDFGVAISLLKKILHLQDEYSFPARYYYGLAHYFEDDLEEAVQSLQKLDAAPAYKDRIPYYISQILFKQKKFSDRLCSDEYCD